VVPSDPLTPIVLPISSIANDRQECLNYIGLNTTGMLVKTWGKVTGAASTDVFYVDDGSKYQDGIGLTYGIRVHVPSGTTLPDTGSAVFVTGISRPERTTLTTATTVNGRAYAAGSVIYVPSIWARTVSDVKAL
jgi:hypothetical protein